MVRAGIRTCSYYFFSRNQQYFGRFICGDTDGGFVNACKDKRFTEYFTRHQFGKNGTVSPIIFLYDMDAAGQDDTNLCDLVSGSPYIFFFPQGFFTRRLAQWPVQIKLAAVHAPFFDQADLLIAADCTAYAYGDFHNTFMDNRVTLIGCPKLDSVDYSEKLTAIIQNNNIRSITVVRMEVPCCGGIEHAVKTALEVSGKFILHQVITITTDGIPSINEKNH